jgi:hypothetical protein
MEALVALLLGQANAPFSFRFVVQPALALIIGLRDARLDAKAGKPPYFFSLFVERHLRRDRLREGARAIALPLAIAIALDSVVQYLVASRVHLWHAVVVGALLIALPYVTARGFGNRALTASRRRRPV